MLTFSSLVSAKDFREKGYKGNVSLAGYGIFSPGIETSHGYMINENHYVGVLGGVNFLPLETKFTKAFFSAINLDYTWYIMDKRSTPIVGMRVGPYFTLMKSDEKRTLYITGMVLPNVGWSWGLKSGNALNAKIGVWVTGISFSSTKSLPFISLGFEF